MAIEPSDAAGSDDPEGRASRDRQALRRNLSLHIQGWQDALAALEGLSGNLPVRELRNSSRRGGPLDKALDGIRLHPYLPGIDVAGCLPPPGGVGAAGGVKHDLDAAYHALHDAFDAARSGKGTDDRLDVDALRISIASAYAALRRVDAALGGPPDGFARRVGPTQPKPKKVRHVDAVYPDVAGSARVQEFVIVELTIGTDGSVNHAEVLRSAPPFDQAALAAVRQWKFEPARFNGLPTAVVTVETVNFVLP